MTVSSRHVVTCARSFQFEIVTTQHVFCGDNPCLAATVCSEQQPGARRAFVVVDRNVFRAHEADIRRYFAEHAVDATIHSLDVSERAKQMSLVLDLARRLAEHRIMRRREPLVAIGGGVLLDVCGFVASMYRRGIPYLRVPTTLVGYIDAGIGVKTGVNLEERKSRLGAYYPPKLVILDKTFLATLSPRHIANGVAEIIKLALMKSQCLFGQVEAVCPNVLATRFQASESEDRILADAVALMLEELSGNLWEEQLNRCVDFGHTFSPLLEMRDDCALLHGEAVAWDMALCAMIAKNRGGMTIEQCERVLSVLSSCHLLDARVDLNPRSLADALADATVHRDGLQRLPLPVGIGNHEFVCDVTPAEIATAAFGLSSVLARYGRADLYRHAPGPRHWALAPGMPTGGR